MPPCAPLGKDVVLTPYPQQERKQLSKQSTSTCGSTGMCVILRPRRLTGSRNACQFRQRLPVPRMRSASARADRNGIRDGNAQRRHDDRICDPGE